MFEYAHTGKHTHTHTHTDIHTTFQSHTYIHTPNPIHIHTCMHLLTTAPVTKSGLTMLELAVRDGSFDIIKCLVTVCSASVNGEQSVYVSPAVCVSVRSCMHVQIVLLH